VTGGLGAGLTPGLATGGDGSPDGGGTVRFNGLNVTAASGGNSSSGGLPALADPRVQMIAQGSDSSLEGPSEDAVTGPPEAPPVLTPIAHDEEAIDEDTVQIGTGSYELWRRKPKRPASSGGGAAR
jgi:hypothetical protein